MQQKFKTYVRFTLKNKIFKQIYETLLLLTIYSRNKPGADYARRKGAK